MPVNQVLQSLGCGFTGSLVFRSFHRNFIFSSFWGLFSFKYRCYTVEATQLRLHSWDYTKILPLNIHGVCVYAVRVFEESFFTPFCMLLPSKLHLTPGICCLKNMQGLSRFHFLSSSLLLLFFAIFSCKLLRCLTFIIEQCWETNNSKTSRKSMFSLGYRSLRSFVATIDHKALHHEKCFVPLFFFSQNTRSWHVLKTKREVL